MVGIPWAVLGWILLDFKEQDRAGLGSWSSGLSLTPFLFPALPEGLAVGVGFGAVGKSASATFQSAR